MLFFTLTEIIYIVITIVIVGLIFSRTFDKEEIIFWMKVAGLSIILHELFHKFSAILLGYPAYYQISIFGLLLGLLFKFAGFPFIFFIPGYVVFYGPITPIAQAIIAVAGPSANLLLYIVGKYLYKKYQKEEYYALYRLNFWLFVLNMLPIPPLDGFKFFSGLIYTIL